MAPRHRLFVSNTILNQYWSANNTNIDPSEISVRSTEDYLWICPNCNIEFERSAKSMYKSIHHSCKECTRKINNVNIAKALQPQNTPSVADIDWLMELWCEQENLYIDPKTVFVTSEERFYFRCPECKKPIKKDVYRIYKGERSLLCLKCSCKKSALKRKEKKFLSNELIRISDSPAAKYWHPSKNLPITPDIVSTASEKPYFWMCPECKNEWERTADDFCRSLICPRCTVPKIADIPEMMAEFSKNNPKGLEELVTSHSDQKVLFICQNCGNDYERSADGWWKLSHLCKDCSLTEKGKKLHNTWENKEIRTRVYDCPEEDSIKNRSSLMTIMFDNANNDISSSEVAYRSHKIYNWECQTCKQVFPLSAQRVSYGIPCPHCKTVRLGVPPKTCSNPLSETNPELLDFWDYETNKQNTPDLYSASSPVIASWKCAFCGESYLSSPQNRVNTLMCCPTCMQSRHTSFPEQALLYYLSLHFICESRIKLDGNEFDIYLPQIKTAIEYDGRYYHKAVNEIKQNYCKQKNIRFICIVEGKENKHEGNIIYTKYNKNKIDDYFIRETYRILSPNITVNVDLSRDNIDILSQYITGIRKNSIAVKYPYLALEWNYEKNKGLKPESFTRHSTVEVWWRCSECGYEYQKEIKRRTGGKHYTTCPMCKHKTSLLKE